MIGRGLSGAVFVVALALTGSGAGLARADAESGWQAYLDGDNATALAELRPAAEEGDARAQYYLAVLYDHGKAVPRNHRTAANWYNKAARQGDEDAQLKLGLMYDDGAGSAGDPNGVPADPALAALWLSSAAKSGHPMASYRLCKLVDRGRGVERDLDRALSLCRYAALQGVAGAQYHTGLLLAESEADFEVWTEAYSWFLLAARANYPGAAQNLETLTERLSADDLARGRAMADEFEPVAQE
jgi:TPR repeat protein